MTALDIGSLALQAHEIARTFNGRATELIDMLMRAPALQMKEKAHLLPAEAGDLIEKMDDLRDAFIRFETALYAQEVEAA
ncbi:MAG: hypothetical protein ACKO0Z_15110 [Betaproteobacteria bacterium]